MVEEKRDPPSPFSFVIIDHVGTAFRPSIGCVDIEWGASSHDFQRTINKQIKGTGRDGVLVQRRPKFPCEACQSEWCANTWNRSPGCQVKCKEIEKKRWPRLTQPTHAWILFFLAMLRYIQIFSPSKWRIDIVVSLACDWLIHIDTMWHDPGP